MNIENDKHTLQPKNTRKKPIAKETHRKVD